MTDRNTKYNKDLHPDLIYKLALLSHTEEEIAETIGIHKTTLTSWKKRYPEVEKALWRGKGPADAEVAESVYKAACGYMVEEQYVNKQGEVVSINKWHRPDVRAATLWLCNRQENWKAPNTHAKGATNNVNITIATKESNSLISEVIGARVDDEPTLIEHDTGKENATKS